MPNIIETKDLSYVYPSGRKALDKVSLTVKEGAIYGFLGPNGAGKSTTMRILTGIIPVDQPDQVHIFGKPLQPQLPCIFEHIGTLVEQPALYLHLSGYDNLLYLTKMYGRSKEDIMPALERVGLARDAKVKAKNYSLGMKQRLAIAMALLNKPTLLLLDEPVNGLDPSGIQEIRHLLQELNKEGVTVFVSSHLLAEIEKLCTYVGIIHHGRLQFQGTMKELGQRYQQVMLELRMGNPHLALPTIQALYPKAILRSSGEQHWVEVPLPDRESIGPCVRAVANAGIDLYEVKSAGGLEEWFMDMIA